MRASDGNKENEAAVCMGCRWYGKGIVFNEQTQAINWTYSLYPPLHPPIHQRTNTITNATTQSRDKGKRCPSIK
jgi:hypothetical protein